MSKKKATGLSKKVPTIFQGIPDLDPAPAPSTGAKIASRVSREILGLLPRFTDTRNVCFLFEIRDSLAQAIIAKRNAFRWDVVDVKRHFFESGLDGKPKENNEALSQWLKEVVLESSKGQPYQSRVLLSGFESYFTEIPKPEVPAKEMKDNVVWQIAEQLPFAVEEATVLFKEKNTTVLAAAVETQIINKTLSIFHQAGIHPDLVTLLPWAYQSLNVQHSLIPEKNALLVDFSDHDTSLLMMHQGEFQFVRDIHLGGEDITRAMMGTLVIGDQQVTIQYAEADSLKESLGLPTPDLMPIAEEPKHSQLAARIRPIFEKIGAEIRNCLIQFQRQFPEEKIEQIYLSGTETNLKGLDQYFQKTMNVPVQKIDIKKVNSRLDHSLAGLFGIVYCDPNEFNFAPSEDLWRSRFEGYRDLLKLGTVVLGAFFAVIFLVTSVEIFFSHLEYRSQEKKLHSMAPTAQKLDELNSIMKEIDDRHAALEKNIGSFPHMGAVMRELSRIIPGAMRLEKIVYSRNPSRALEMAGVVRAGSRPPDLVLSDFLERLNQSPFFQYASLQSRKGREEGKEAAVGFTIEAHLVLPRES